MNEDYIKKHLLHKPEHVVRKFFDMWQESLEMVPSGTPSNQSPGYYQGLVGYAENPDKQTFEEFVEGWPAYDKLRGIPYELDGETYWLSSTKEDYWGLSSAYAWFKAGNSSVWRFSNGTLMPITADTIDDMYAVWLPFRLKFFE